MKLPLTRFPAMFAALAGLAVALSGCFEYEEELTLKKDLSGVAQIRCRFTGNYKPLMDAIPSRVATSNLRRMNEDAPKGVTYRFAGLTKVRREKWIALNISFKDVNTLRTLVPTYRPYLTRALSVPLFDDLTVTDLGDGTFHYRRNALDSRKVDKEVKYEGDTGGPEITPGEDGKDPPKTRKKPRVAPTEKAQDGGIFTSILKWLRKAFKDEDMILRYRVNFPSAPVHSDDATETRKKSAQWRFTFKDRKERGEKASRMTAVFGKPRPKPAKKKRN